MVLIFVLCNSDFSFGIQFRNSASEFSFRIDYLIAQASEFDLEFSRLSIFQYRGTGHRTVVEMADKDRTLHSLAQRDKVWRAKNNKRKKEARTDADKPLWSVFVFGFPKTFVHRLTPHHTQVHLGSRARGYG